MSRINNSIKNVSYAMVGQILNLLISFITRMIFIKYLSTEYLGIDGLFANILSMLAIAELGIGTAINFSLYEPLAKDNKKEIKILMNLYKKVYNYIGVIIFIGGLLITPFINVFLKEAPNIDDNLYIIFFLYVLNSASTYFFTYKRSLIIAAQKAYITTTVHYIVYFIVNILQIIILIISQNFMLYLAIKFIFNFIENFILSIIANKMFPFIKDKTADKLDEGMKENIVKNVKAMFYHKIGGIFVLATDNMIISKFVNITSVGLYSNYLIIINAVNSMISNFFNSLIASVGNLAVQSDKDNIRRNFNIIYFIGFWIFSVSSICLFILLNPFIELWIGKEYTFSNNIVLILVINFYLAGMRQPTLTFRTAMGLFWHDRYKPLFEGIINIIISSVLAIKFGIFGVFLGTTISTLTTCFWIEPYVLYKYGLKYKLTDYFIKYFKYFAITTISLIITVVFSSFINYSNIGGFILKIILCLIIPNVIFTITFYKTKEFKYLRNLGVNIINKLLKKYYPSICKK